MSGNWEMSSARMNLEEYFGDIQDTVIREIIRDLCAYGRGKELGTIAGPLMTYEFWKSGDCDEQTFRASCKRFKDKWLNMNSDNLVRFYQDELQKKCDELKKEFNDDYHNLDIRRNDNETY